MHWIRYRKYLFLLCGLIGIALVVNSCKKDNTDTVSYFLTAGKWQLASVTRQNFVGDTLKRTDTLNTACDSTQLFTFKNDNTCSYINYHCIAQSSTGRWTLSSDNLNIQTTFTVQDTVKGAIVKGKNEFANAQIETLGQYSLVLNTGFTSSFYTSKTVRVITRYGFVHPTTQ